MINLPSNVNPIIIQYFQNTPPESAINNLAAKNPDQLITLYGKAIKDWNWRCQNSQLMNRMIAVLESKISKGEFTLSQIIILSKKTLKSAQFSVRNRTLIHGIIKVLEGASLKGELNLTQAMNVETIAKKIAEIAKIDSRVPSSQILTDEMTIKSKIAPYDVTKTRLRAAGTFFQKALKQSFKEVQDNEFNLPNDSDKFATVLKDFLQTGEIQKETVASLDEEAYDAIFASLKSLEMPELVFLILSHAPDQVLACLDLAYQWNNVELRNHCFDIINKQFEGIKFLAMHGRNISIETQKLNFNYDDLKSFIKMKPPFTGLYLQDCSWITDDVIALLATSCEDLQEIILNRCPKITGLTLKALNDHCPHLQILDLSNCRNLKQLPELKNPFPELVSLNLANCRNLQNSSLNDLLNICPNLTSINLDEISLNEEDIEALVKTHPHLNQVSLNSSLDAISTILVNLNTYCRGHLRSLNLKKPIGGILQNKEVMGTLERFSQLTSLNLEGRNSLTDLWITNLLNACSNLTSFTLTNCPQIRDEHFSLLAKQSPLLQEVDLSGSRFTGNTVEILNKFCAKLRSLKLNSSALSTFKIPKLTNKFENLEFLTFRGHRLPKIDHYINLIEACPKLLSLDVSNVKALNDEMIKAIGEHCPLLKEIDLNGCNITLEGLKILNQKCKNLQSLCFSVDSLTSYLDPNTQFDNPFSSLTTLTIDLDRSRSHIKYFESFVRACPNLTLITLKNFSVLSEVEVEIIAKNCSKLTTIAFDNCGDQFTLQSLNRYSKELTCLTLNDFDISELPSFDLSFHKIDILNLKIKGASWQPVLNLIKACPTLDALDLETENMNYFSDVITTLASNSSSLRFLSWKPELYHNFSVYKYNMDEVISALSSIAKNSPQWSYLAMPLSSSTTNEHMAQLIPAFQTLETLVLYNLDSISLKALKNLVIQCPNLTSLTLHYQNSSFDRKSILEALALENPLLEIFISS